MRLDQDLVVMFLAGRRDYLTSVSLSSENVGSFQVSPSPIPLTNQERGDQTLIVEVRHEGG